MNLSKLIKISLNQIFINKKYILNSLIITYGILVIYGNNTIKVIQNLNLEIGGVYCVFDVLLPIITEVGVLGPLPLVTIIVPIYILIIFKCSNESNTMYCLRMKSRKNIWMVKVIVSIIISIIYCFAIVFGSSLILGIITKGNILNWQSEISMMYRLGIINDNISTIKISIEVILNLMLGLSLIGMIVNLLSNITKQKSVVFLLILIVCYYDAIMKTSLLLGRVYFKPQYLISGSTQNIITLIIVNLILFIVGYIIEKQKEYA